MGTVAIVLVCGLGMLLWERTHPGQQFPRVNGWVVRSITLNAVQGLVAYVAAVSWDKWMSGIALAHLGGHGVVLDAFAGYLVLTFVYYWWHRARHEIPVLWRWFHQVHHSATRIELLTSFYKHPVEIAFNGVLSSFVLYVLLGFEPAAAALASTMTGLAELVYHWNVRTPYWMGFLFQRPESHCVHHQRGHHTDNFSDLPLWDMLFGTFNNPREVPRECGFGIAREQQLGLLLRGARTPYPGSKQ